MQLNLNLSRHFFSCRTQTFPYQAVSIEKVFFGSCHGKNDSDWLGGSVKRAVITDVARGKVTVTNAGVMYDHCRKTLTVPDKGGCQHKVRKFFLLPEIKKRVNAVHCSWIQKNSPSADFGTWCFGIQATLLFLCFMHGRTVPAVLFT